MHQGCGCGWCWCWCWLTATFTFASLLLLLLLLLLVLLMSHSIFFVIGGRVKQIVRARPGRHPPSLRGSHETVIVIIIGRRFGTFMYLYHHSSTIITLIIIIIIISSSSSLPSSSLIPHPSLPPLHRFSPLESPVTVLLQVRSGRYTSRTQSYAATCTSY